MGRLERGLDLMTKVTPCWFCDEPRKQGSSFCQRHFDMITPENLKGIIYPTFGNSG